MASANKSKAKAAGTATTESIPDELRREYYESIRNLRDPIIFFHLYDESPDPSVTDVQIPDELLALEEKLESGTASGEEVSTALSALRALVDQRTAKHSANISAFNQAQSDARLAAEAAKFQAIMEARFATALAQFEQAALQQQQPQPPVPHHPLQQPLPRPSLLSMPIPAGKLLASVSPFALANQLNQPSQAPSRLPRIALVGSVKNNPSGSSVPVEPPRWARGWFRT